MSRSTDPNSLLGRVRELLVTNPGISNADIFARLESDYRDYDSVYFKLRIKKYRGLLKKKARK